MSCTPGIAKAIASTCDTSKNGGLEVKMWAFNRKNITITYDGTSGNKITAIANVSTNKGYAITGVKKLFNAGHDIVVAADRPNKYKHIVEFQQFERLAADILNVDRLEDIVIVAESKDKSTTGEGVFFVYGPTHGLYVTTDTMRHNDVNGARKITLETMEGEEEPYSEFTYLATDYATSLAALNALL